MNLFYSKNNNYLIYKVLISFLILSQYNNTIAQEMKSIKKDSSYTIAEHPMDVYEGVYKNNKPYNGYFKKGNQELFVVDYYEEGIKKYNYSFDILQMLQEGKLDRNPQIELNKKSIYKNEKIFDGVKYHYIKDGILVEQYKGGKHTGFYVDIFAIHYYNRFSFKIEKDKLEILSLRNEEYSIKVLSKNNFISIELYKNDVIVTKSQNIDPNTIKFPVNSSIRIYKEDGVMKGVAYQDNNEIEGIHNEATEIIEIFNRLENRSANNLWDIFNTLLKDIISNKYFIDIERNITQDIIFIGDFISDQEGNIKEGIRLYENKKETYFCIFENGKMIKKENINELYGREI
ncbi:hypothetical protein ACSTS3_06305 [Aquimarina muelleri]|uniref:hypothetical protein n=1 Tax=Aquimarina muelleri TaxID=279356 RepID=UPI003F6839C1